MDLVGIKTGMLSISGTTLPRDTAGAAVVAPGRQ
jgi:hypothetical protein